MTETNPSSDAAEALEPYLKGSDRYIRFAEDILGLTLADTQKEILRALASHRRTQIVSGNGVGKSYAVAAGILAFLYTHVNCFVLGTSGSYSQFEDAMWNKMIEEMWKSAKERYPLDGEELQGQQPKLRINKSWYAKIVSPTRPGGLEGRHAADGLAVIEEADKDDITEDHYDAARSTITGVSDRQVAVANPPKSKANVVYEKMEAEDWHTIQFSSFESHNVLVDADVIEGERIPGLVGLPTVAEDWEAYNNLEYPLARETYEDRYNDSYPGVADLTEQIEDPDTEFTHEDLCEILRPGFEEIREAHEHRDDLDERWYRRRAGVIPRDNAEVHRPIYTEEVQQAYEPDATSDGVIGVGLDVARKGGDVNILSYYYGDHYEVVDAWQGLDHNENEARVRQTLGDVDVPFYIDAQGEGSGLADRLCNAYPSAMRFDAGGEPPSVEVDGENPYKQYYNLRAEGLVKLGRSLRNGATYNDKTLREELLATARSIEITEKHYKSRGATVYKVSGKDATKDVLGRSPDRVDSLYMSRLAGEGVESRVRRVDKSGAVLSTSKRSVGGSQRRRSRNAGGRR